MSALDWLLSENKVKLRVDMDTLYLLIKTQRLFSIIQECIQA